MVKHVAVVLLIILSVGGSRVSICFGIETGQLTIATPYGPATAVPDPAKGSNGWYIGEAGVTETLFTIDFDMGIKPWLVNAYRRITPRVWEIELKPGILFHDRTSLSARAVKWSLSRLLNENSPVFNKRVEQLLDIKNITITADQRLQFETRHPNAAFLHDLTSPDTAIISPGSNDRQIYGTGPFKLDKVIPKEKMIVSRFDDYWGEKARIEKICLNVIANPTTRMLAFEAHQLDIATYFPENDAVRIASRENLRIVHAPTNRLCFFFVRTKDGPLADIRIRQAINYAIDRQQIVSAVLSGIGGKPCASVFPETLPWSNRDLLPYPFDPDKASALLAQVGARDGDGDGILEIQGQPLMLNMWTYETRAALKPTLELVQAQLLKVGIGSQLKVTRKADPINQAMRNGEVHLNLQMWNTAPQGDPDFFIASIFTTDAGSNFMGFHNDELDALTRQGKMSFDPVKRKQVYDRIQKILYDECPVIVLFHKSMVSAIADHVTHYRIHPAERYLVTPQLGRR